MLTFNKYLIYQQIGNSVIKINDEESIIINAETSSSNQITNYELLENDVYLIQLQTDSGNTVLSFKLIKKSASKLCFNILNNCSGSNRYIPNYRIYKVKNKNESKLNKIKKHL